MKYDRPMMFYQPGDKNSWDRIRLVYPDGTMEWYSLINVDLFNYHPIFTIPCYLINKDIKSAKNSIKLMHKYDRKRCFPRAEFLGYL